MSNVQAYACKTRTETTTGQNTQGKEDGCKERNCNPAKMRNGTKQGESLQQQIAIEIRLSPIPRDRTVFTAEKLNRLNPVVRGNQNEAM